jgi:hypothetical protein
MNKDIYDDINCFDNLLYGEFNSSLIDIMNDKIYFELSSNFGEVGICLVGISSISDMLTLDMKVFEKR